MRFNHKAFVRWDDLDAFGHVNNAKYLVYAQEARFEWGYQQFAEKKALPDAIGPSTCTLTLCTYET